MHFSFTIQLNNQIRILSHLTSHNEPYGPTYMSITQFNPIKHQIIQIIRFLIHTQLCLQQAILSIINNIGHLQTLSSLVPHTNPLSHVNPNRMDCHQSANSYHHSCDPFNKQVMYHNSISNYKFNETIHQEARETPSHYYPCYTLQLSYLPPFTLIRVCCQCCGILVNVRSSAFATSLSFTYTNIMLSVFISFY